MRTRLISAICTPLKDDDSLHLEGLAAHLDDQWRHGISGVLIGGCMGLMQMLSENTYRDLMRHGVALARGHGEVLVGAGDTSLARTLQRVEYVGQFDVDGVVVLLPYFWPLRQNEAIDYFRALADRSHKPIYIYNWPTMTKVTLELDTVLELSKHPNILGMKDSGDWAETWQLIQYVGDTFRVIPAQGLLLDLLARCGLPENMEGIYAVVPELAMSIVEAVENKDNVLASRQQAKLAALLRLVLGKYPLFPACSAMLNARGIPGKFFPAPIQAMSVEELERFFNEPLIRELAGKPTPATIV